MKEMVAEFVGTFALLFAGVGAIALGVNLVGVALAHGLAIALFVTAVGHISGGHLNPAVTLGFLAIGKIKFVKAVQYWIAQIAGAVAAMYVLLFTHGVQRLENANWGQPLLAEGVGTFQGISLEALMTFFLMFVIMGTAVDTRASKVGGFAIGLAVTMGILLGGNLTGAALNPARAFGPQLVSGNWTDFIVYLIGPSIGAVLAAVLYYVLYLRGGEE